jgi:hypothetical protein
MKNSLVIAVLILLSSATQAQKYSWNYMEIGYSDNGLGKGPTFSVASHVTGNLAMAGLAGGSGKLKTKIGMGAQDIMDQRWSIFEADASYAFSDNLGISLGIMDLDELGGKMTKFGLRLRW